MKLYFYHLYKPTGEKPRIEVEECEVEERQKTYKPVDGFPKFYYGSYVKKEIIGTVYEDTVILAEMNCAKAAEIFKEKFHDDIKWNQERIERSKKEAAKSYDLIDMVDDWRLEHEVN